MSLSEKSIICVIAVTQIGDPPATNSGKPSNRNGSSNFFKRQNNKIHTTRRTDKPYLEHSKDLQNALLRTLTLFDAVTSLVLGAVQGFIRTLEHQITALSGFECSDAHGNGNRDRLTLEVKRTLLDRDAQSFKQ